jgi:flagellar protein FliO/FliZ
VGVLARQCFEARVKLMGFLEFIRAVAALAVTLGLIGVIAVAARRYAPKWIARLQGERGPRRLQLVETLVLDASRRLVLVKLDDQERLIILGDGHLLDAGPPSCRAPAPLKSPLLPKALS